MSDLFKEMCSLAGKLSDFVDGIKNDEARKNLLALHLKVTVLCERVSNQEFDENDDFYRDTIEKMAVNFNRDHDFKKIFVMTP